MIDVVEQQLSTPIGLRSLAPSDRAYVPHYEGNVWHRDTAYHQGTVWPWLMGPFVQAWLESRDNTASAKREAEQRFVEPLRSHLNRAGIGHVWKSPTPSRRSRRAAVRSKPGPYRNCCASQR